MIALAINDWKWVRRTHVSTNILQMSLHANMVIIVHTDWDNLVTQFTANNVLTINLKPYLKYSTVTSVYC